MKKVFKTLQTNIAVNNPYDTRPTPIQYYTDHSPQYVDLKCFFFNFTKMFVCIIVIRAYFINILQGSVETHLRCGEIYNNRIIANSPQSVPVKEF